MGSKKGSDPKLWNYWWLFCHWDPPGIWQAPMCIYTCICILCIYGCSKNRGTPKWMVYLLKWMIWGGKTNYFRKHPYVYIYMHVCINIYIYKHQTQTKFHPEHVVETVPTTWWRAGPRISGCWNSKSECFFEVSFSAKKDEINLHIIKNYSNLYGRVLTLFIHIYIYYT